MWPVGYPTAAYAEDQLAVRTKPNPLKETLNQRSKYSLEFILNSTESFSRQDQDFAQYSESVAQDTAWVVQVFTATCRVIIGIDMDDTKMFQQDYLGCVDDEANIVNKCDAMRQVTTDHIFSSLSRRLGRLMSIMMTMTMTAAVYAITVPTMFVSKNTLCCYDKQNKVGRYDEMYVRCCDVCRQCTSALGSAKSTLSELCLPALLIKQRERDKNLQDTKFTKQRKRLKKKVGNQRDKKNKMLNSYP